jgi:cation diffusion facilitator family transporter
MLHAILVWLGFVQPKGEVTHDHAKSHGHTHGVIDSTLATTTQGIWAIKWSFAILGITSLLQLAVVYASASIALFADAIHNVGDSATAIPLWIAFMLARRKPSERFAYGYGRAEDLAGIAIVLIILLSALVAAYAAIDRLVHPQSITLLGWVAVAGFLGFVGNEAVAIFRIRIGRKINSAALNADGYHARTDGLTSLAVVLGALGVWLGYPVADPIIGLLITIAIFGIVWQSAKAVLTRALDGVDGNVPKEIRHAIAHVPGVRAVETVRARWLGHRLTADLDVAIDGTATLREADAIRAAVREELQGHLPSLATVRIVVQAFGGQTAESDGGKASKHHHAPAPVAVRGKLAEGMLEIVDTPQGERMQFSAKRAVVGLTAVVRIKRDAGQVETLALNVSRDDPTKFMSTGAPQEPHTFQGDLVLNVRGRSEAVPFRVFEPDDHH